MPAIALYNHIPYFDTYEQRTGLKPHPGEYTDPSGWYLYATMCDLGIGRVLDPHDWYTLFNQMVVIAHAPAGYSGDTPVLDIAYNAAVPGAFSWRADANGFLSQDPLTGDDVSIGITGMYDWGSGRYATLLNPSYVFSGSIAQRNYYVDQAHADADFGSHPAAMADWSYALGNWPKLAPIPTDHHGLGDYLLYESPYKDEELFFVGSFFQGIAQIRVTTGGTTFPNFPGTEVVAQVPFSLGTRPGVAINGKYPDARRNVAGQAQARGFARW